MKLLSWVAVICFGRSFTTEVVSITETPTGLKRSGAFGVVLAEVKQTVLKLYTLTTTSNSICFAWGRVGTLIFTPVLWQQNVLCLSQGAEFSHSLQELRNKISRLKTLTFFVAEICCIMHP
ncbi:MAG: hypothetical protein JO110_27440 [Acetobacteraceae bacterium]|nr:hypothetical protein [Acetobacteraceae bacterium]